MKWVRVYKMDAKLNAFYEHMAQGKEVKAESEIMLTFHELSQQALKLTMELNNKYHTPEEIVDIFSKLTGKEVDKSFRLFPPFYTDCGKNITVGKNVFINSCCHFQDQGGVFIDDGTLIGHNVTLATLNHEENPKERQNIHPAPIKIGKNVWIGANVTILPGVTIGDGSIIGAGAVVTKNIPENAVALGIPAKIAKYIEAG